MLVDISDALSERDRVRFTVHTRTKLAQFTKQVMSVVRQHEEFIWLHDCLEDNDQYAGYIIPPAPPRPDFEASREKLQRLGDGEANLTKEEFAKMKQELEAEYLAIFKKTVAMHEIFLQRLAAHEKFREDNNFKIFLEYENELAVRCKSKKEKITGSIQNIGKSLTDFVITTSQVAATTSASTSLLIGNHHSPNKHALGSARSNPNHRQRQQQLMNGNTSSSDIMSNSSQVNTTLQTNEQSEIANSSNTTNTGDGSNSQQYENNNLVDDNDDIDEQYFEKERLFLALYHNSIRETAIQADKVTHVQKCLADTYLYIAQQLVKLASIQVVPVTAQTKDLSSFVACPLPSLTLPPSLLRQTTNSPEDNQTASLSNELGDDDNDDLLTDRAHSSRKISGKSQDNKQRDNSLVYGRDNSTSGCANDHTSEGLKQLLLHVSDYFEQARKVETRIASDEDLKLTDTFLYYKRDTVAAQNLLVRRLRFMAEYETATKNLEKARLKGRTQMQYADVIQKQARENFISISRLAKQELINYKQRRVVSFKKAFSDLAELELKHLRSHSQLIRNCLNACRGIQPVQVVAENENQIASSSSTGQTKREPGTQLRANPTTTLTTNSIVTPMNKIDSVGENHGSAS